MDSFLYWAVLQKLTIILLTGKGKNNITLSAAAILME